MSLSNLPNWWFLVAYLAGGAWLLFWECVAVWVDREPGDTITEYTRSVLTLPILWFVLAGLFVWLVDHLLFDDLITHWIRSLRS